MGDPRREKKYELQSKRVRYRLPAEPSASSLAAHNLASEGLCEGKRTLLHSGCDNRCFVSEGQDKKQGVGGEIIIGQGLAFGACRCWKEDDLLLQCPQWHLATFPEPRLGGWEGGRRESSTTRHLQTFYGQSVLGAAGGGTAGTGTSLGQPWRECVIEQPLPKL